MAVHRPELPLSGAHGVTDGYSTISRCRRCGIVIGFGDRCDLCLNRGPGRRSDQADPPGFFRGRHHTEWASTVDELILQGDDDEAEFLLVRLVEATEAETLLSDVPPFERHFRRLEQIARRRGDRKLEAMTLQRYTQCVERVCRAG